MFFCVTLPTKDRQESSTSRNFLVLLDELGAGTDPDAGYAISRAVLEHLLELDGVRIIATTHSPQLKAFAVNDERSTSASVLLENSNMNVSGYRRPTFKLAYNSVGDSHALAAAARCPFPSEVLERAAEILGGENEDITSLTSLTDALEKEKEEARAANLHAGSLVRDARNNLQMISKLASSYEKKLGRIEAKLDGMVKILQEDTTDSMELVGESLQTLRLQRRKIKSEAEKLADRGLKFARTDYQFAKDEIVVIITEPWDGETARVVGSSPSEVIVVPTFGLSVDADIASSSITLKRDQIALWDYLGSEGMENVVQGSTVSRSRQHESLASALSSISSQKTKKEETKIRGKGSGNQFISSRQRKAASKSSAKKKKKR